MQIDVPIDQEYLITGGALPGIYKMDQMHFHWASEHTIDSKRYFNRPILIRSSEESEKNRKLIGDLKKNFFVVFFAQIWLRIAYCIPQ